MSESNDNSAELRRFATDLLELPWGSLSKSELEFRVFQLLASTGNIDQTRSDVQLAQDLATTLSKVRALRFKSQQRKYRKKEVWDWDELLSVDHVTLHSVTDKGAAMILYAKDPFLKEVLSEKLREGDKPVLVRSSFTPGHLKVDGVSFWLKVLDDGSFSQKEYDKIQEKLESTFPKKEGAVAKALDTANTGAGAANIASFILAFLDKISPGN